MQPARITGATRVIGKSQGYLGLPLRDDHVEFMLQGILTRHPTMTSAWTPSPKELELLNAGANVEISVHGLIHPPIKVGVGLPAPDED